MDQEAKFDKRTMTWGRAGYECKNAVNECGAPSPLDSLLLWNLQVM